MYTFRRTKLSTLYEEIGKYLKENGDADIRSIDSLNGDSEASYRLILSDLNSFNTKCIGEVKAKFENVQYTQEEWQIGFIKSSKILNLLDAMNCCLRKNGLCGMTETCKRCSYMKRVIELWIDFCNTPVDGVENYITQEWGNFPIGTERVVIMNWFINTYDVDIKVLMQYAGSMSRIA